MKNIILLTEGVLKGRRVGIFRGFVQAAFTLFSIYAGYNFYMFYLWACGISRVTHARPPSVEAFLPISALVGLKRLILTGRWDMVHPAGLTVFLAIIAISFLLRKSFCGWICPVGFISNIAEKTGRAFHLLFRLPAWVDIPLLSLKYLLLGFFCYLILWQMDMKQIELFLTSPYNMTADVRMLVFFLRPSTLSLAVMLFLLIISFFIRNFWCRYLCPYGALLGILAMASPFQVKRDPDICITCGKCEDICPASIKITQRSIIRTPECTGCTECISSCPVEQCLSLGTPFKRSVPAMLLPVLAISLFLLFWLVSLVTGHWHTQISPEMIKYFCSRMSIN
jgi:polyferredoxin